MKFIKKHILLLLLSTTLFLIGSSLNVIYSFVLGDTINSAIELNSELFVKSLQYNIALLIGGGLFTYLGGKANVKYATKTIIDYKNDLANKITGLDVTNYFIHNQSYYLNTLTRESRTIKDRYFFQVGLIIQDILGLVTGIVGLFFINWKYAIVVILLTFVPMLVPIILGPVMSKKEMKASQKNEKYIIELKGILEGFEIIKSFGLKNRILKKFSNANISTEDSNYRVNDTQNLMNSLSYISAGTVILISIGFGVYLVFKKEMTIGLLFAGVQIFNYLMQPIMGLTQRLSVLAGTKSIRDKHDQLLKINTDTTEESIKLSKINSVKINNLNFAYKDEDVIRGINTEFLQDKKYAVIGESGSGKSTLLKLIMGYYNDYQGEILYDEQELKSINKKQLYFNFAMIHQNIFLFEDSIEDNIKLYKNVNEKDYNRAIKQANLLGVIEKLRKENDLCLRDNGQQLSGGEKQRVAIARSLLLNTHFLLIDEATASLDPENAKVIYDTLLNLKEVGCLAVTHDWNNDLLESFDEVVFMNKGKILCKGPWLDIKDTVMTLN